MGGEVLVHDVHPPKIAASLPSDTAMLPGEERWKLAAVCAATIGGH